MLAFSYIRFSSKKQELSDSLRRQTEMSKKYAQLHNLTLSEQSFEDLGVSAFKGLNSDVSKGGGLGLFLRAVDEGVIPNNCYLLVESLDRVSRATVDEALELFLSIIKRGITIVSLIDNQEFSQARIQQDRGIGLIISITSFIRAHEESAVKSARIAAAWTQKRKTKKILTSHCPAWLKVSEDKSEYLLIPEKVELVQKIFDYCIQGMGTILIARELNTQGVPLLSGKIKAWSPANVASTLGHHGVYGLYIPSKAKNVAPVEDQYPVIVSKERFDRAQELIATRSPGRRTKDEEVGNLWGSISYCKECGSRFRFYSGSSKTSDIKYFCCQLSADSSQCSSKKFGYQPMEEQLLETVFQMVPSIEFKHSAVPIVDYQKMIEEKQKQINNLIEFIADGMGSTFIRDKINLLQSEIEELKKKIIKQPIQSPTEQIYARAYRFWQKLKFGNLDFAETQQVRSNLRAEFSRLFSRLEVSSGPHTDGEHIYRRVYLSGEWNKLMQVGEVFEFDFKLPPIGLYASRTKKMIRDGKVKMAHEVYK